MMNYNYIIFYLFVIFSSCKKENRCDCFNSAGKTNIIYHSVSGFNCLKIEDKFDVYITQDSTFEVKIEAGANLQRLIKTKLNGDTLEIMNNNKCNIVRGYKNKIKVFVSAPYFKYILHNGIGEIKSLNTITQNELKVRIENSGAVNLDINTNTFTGGVHGNGDLYLSGTTNNIFWNYFGTNYAYLSKLTITNYVFLSSNSLGHAYINAPPDLMDVVIKGSGNVYYTGNTSTINLTKYGKGNLIKQ